MNPAEIEPVHIERLHSDSRHLTEDLEMLGHVLHACVHSGASVSFVLPFSRDDAIAFWRDKVVPAVAAGDCRVLLARIAGNIVGTVQIDLATPPNQRHRAEVRKLLVHPEARRRGIARKLMSTLEQDARQLGRSLLTLDTVTGASAEPLYLSMGYIRVGVIPGYARRPDSSELDSTTIMFKEIG